MSEVSLEKIINEESFARLLEREAEMFFRLARSLGSMQREEWDRRHFFQLVNEADDLEAFLDDYGARYNRTYHFFRELVASVRGIALTGFSIVHLHHRLDSYGTRLSMTAEEAELAQEAIEHSRDYLIEIATTLLNSSCKEALDRGIQLPREAFPVSRYRSHVGRRNLPRNVDQEDLQDEEQKIAEVCSKYLQACDMLQEIGIKRIGNAAERDVYLRKVCTEEKARVYEATVHNLQSAYDTYIKNTVIESRDERLARLRGHVSAALHFLEAVTQLVHFAERHEGAARKEQDRKEPGQKDPGQRDPGRRRTNLLGVLDVLVDRDRVRDVTLNRLLFWADQYMQRGRSLAEDLLPSYTNVQTLQVEIDDRMVLHARPAALIVAIVNRYGTPVEMEVQGHACNAGSILELMVCVGSNPDAKNFVFRGDEHPLRDIGLLFKGGLGEGGLDSLPESLAYLRGS